jgi:PAS domain S-box-containing protein
MITYRPVPKSLRREQRRFQESFGPSETPACLLTPDGTVQDVNDAFCRLLSRTRADTVRRMLLDLTESQDNDLTLAMLDLALAGKVPCLSFRARCRDGTGVPVPVHVQGMLVSDSDSSPVCFVLEMART